MKRFLFLLCIGLFVTGCDQSQSIAGMVDCSNDGDCPDGQVCNTETGVCSERSEEPKHCSNGELDDDETDVDCGGVCDNACDNDLKCEKDNDCKSLNCVEGICEALSCTENKDCDNGICDNKVCTTCADDIQNGLETDVDCGGKHCSACAKGKKCELKDDCRKGLDCIDNVCTPAETPDTCTNGKKDGDETAKDCGGSCPGCDVSLACKVNNDCKEGLVCDNRTCKEANDLCSNGKKDGNETDVDCGGSSCSACDDNKGCSVNTDCKSDFCQNGICVKHQCETAAEGELLISEVFTNPTGGAPMEHSASNQQKFIEIQNTTSKKLRLDNLTIVAGDKTISLSSCEKCINECVDANIFAVLHESNVPLTALTNTGEEYPVKGISSAVKTPGNFEITLKHNDVILHKASVPDMSKKSGISAALPPKNDWEQDKNGAYIMVSHDTINAEEPGKDHPYSPGLHNQAVLPEG